jgi:hypothetical protein
MVIYLDRTFKEEKNEINLLNCWQLTGIMYKRLH